MKYVFGYAGIPGEAYDDIYRRRKSLVGENGNTEFEGVALTLGDAGSVLAKRDANVLLARFKERAVADRVNVVGTKSFAVIYVHPDQNGLVEFEERFFPTTLVFHICWKLEGSSKQERQRSVNELFDRLLKTTIRARDVLKALNKELVERANRTPLLLPLRNFRSNIFKAWLREVQFVLRAQENFVSAAAAISVEVKEFEKSYPLKHNGDPKSKRPCFFDDNDVEFHAPGKALHGLPHVAGNHPAGCVLAGYRRLGAPFHSAFHYDCRKRKKGNLKGDFFRCHIDVTESIEGDPHINIAPNDFIRV